MVMIKPIPKELKKKIIIECRVDYTESKGFRLYPLKPSDKAFLKKFDGWTIEARINPTYR